MEERRLDKRFLDTFDEIVPVMESVRKGFLAQNIALVKEGRAKFQEILKSRAAFAEKVIQEKNRTDAEIRYLSLIIPFQTVALAIENVMEKMEIKVEAKILFSEKAAKEINVLIAIVASQLRDIKDYITTKNPNLKAAIQKSMEDLTRLADEYTVVHQDRMIQGVCMPKASYLYIDITDSLKRLSRGLVAFSEKA